MSSRGRAGPFVTTGLRDLAGNRLDQSATRAGRQPATWTFRTR